MYAKAVIPGTNGVNVPLIVATAAPGQILVQQLRDRGWPPFGGDLFADADAAAEVMPDRFALSIHNEALLEDNTNPVAPAGWWTAVDALGDRAVCVVFAAGVVDLRDGNIGSRMNELLESQATAQGLVHVLHRGGTCASV